MKVSISASCNVLIAQWWWLLGGSDSAGVSGAELTGGNINVSPHCPAGSQWSPGTRLRQKKMLRSKQEAWLSCALGPMALCSSGCLSRARKKVAVTRGTLYSSALKRVLYVIFISQESGGAIPVQLFYLFEALACIEEEKIATCFLKKLLPV